MEQTMTTATSDRLSYAEPSLEMRVTVLEKKYRTLLAVLISLFGFSMVLLGVTAFYLLPIVARTW